MFPKQTNALVGLRGGRDSGSILYLNHDLSVNFENEYLAGIVSAPSWERGKGEAASGITTVNGGTLDKVSFFLL